MSDKSVQTLSFDFNNLWMYFSNKNFLIFYGVSPEKQMSSRPVSPNDTKPNFITKGYEMLYFHSHNIKDNTVNRLNMSIGFIMIDR